MPEPRHPVLITRCASGASFFACKNKEDINDGCQGIRAPFSAFPVVYFTLPKREKGANLYFVKVLRQPDKESFSVSFHCPLGDRQINILHLDMFK